MSKIIRNTIDKKVINSLPVVSFEGRIVTILNESETDKAVAYLMTHPMVGVDTETRPSFARGRSYKVALLQVSTDDVCFLFRLNHIGLPASLQRFLEDKNVMKIGLSLKDDFGALHKRSDFQPGAFLELQQYVADFGIDDKSLQRIYAILFGQRISKAQRLSNWEADVLTDKQKLYAATDAWACLRIYRYVESLRQSGDYQLERIPIENKQTDKQHNAETEDHGVQTCVS